MNSAQVSALIKSGSCNLLAPIITGLVLVAIEVFLSPIKVSALPFNKDCKSMVEYANTKYMLEWH